VKPTRCPRCGRIDRFRKRSVANASLWPHHVARSARLYCISATVATRSASAISTEGARGTAAVEHAATSGCERF